MPAKFTALAAIGLTATVLVGCSSAEEPVTTGGRPVASPTAEPEPASTLQIQPAENDEPTGEPSAASEKDAEGDSDPTFVAQTFQGKSADGRPVTVRVDALAPEDLKEYFKDTGVDEDYLYVMATCEDWCSLADIGPMKLIGPGKPVEPRPVAGLKDQEGPIFDAAPVEASGGAKLPATDEQIETSRADALWDRAFDLSEKYRLGSGDYRHVYVVEADKMSEKVTEVQVRMGRQTVVLTPAL